MIPNSNRTLIIPRSLVSAIDVDKVHVIIFYQDTARSFSLHHGIIVFSPRGSKNQVHIGLYVEHLQKIMVCIQTKHESQGMSIDFLAPLIFRFILVAHKWKPGEGSLGLGLRSLTKRKDLQWHWKLDVVATLRHVLKIMSNPQKQKDSTPCNVSWRM